MASRRNGVRGAENVVESLREDDSTGFAQIDLWVEVRVEITSRKADVYLAFM